ncbi:MAG TPA: large conductance mechanosensitive channel protein MscL [Terracidiphilus sp.]|jgi:large conductance mechanosensitive channel|nr:large conductance mechanosensitive channel protein MscL [Terracidiphilus sp.]
MFKGFRDFVLRGNVVDLAVAVIIGAAFGAIVTSLVSDIINPLIAATVGQPNFSYIILHVGKGEVKVGNFIDHVISFVIIASVVYFAFVLPVNALLSRFKKPVPETPPVTKACPECLSDIPIAAKRCSHCAQPVA